MSVEQNPDLWQQLETYTAQWRSAYKRLDDALNRLDPTAERESKAELEDLFANVRLILEGLQTLHPEDHHGCCQLLMQDACLNAWKK